MVVQFFKGGRTKQGAKSAIAYLLNERVKEGTAKVYEGNPELTLKIISQINRKWKFTSGVISFEEDYQKVSSLLPEITKEFERTFFPGLNKDQYNILYVLHTDKGRAELHFLVPRTELTTGKDLSIYTHKKELKKKDLFQQYINECYNLSNPLDKSKQETLKIEDKKWSNDNKELKKQVHNYVEQAVSKGLVSNREEVINLLQDAGFEIKRRGKDYISIKTDDLKRAIRLKGVYYGESFRSIAELGEEYSNSRTANNRDLQEEIRRIREELNKRVSRDAETNRKKYKVTENRQQQRNKTDIGEHRLGTGAVQNEKKLDMGNRGNDSGNSNNNSNIQNNNNDKGVKDDSTGTKIIRRVGKIRETKQQYINNFKKLIPRAEQINNRKYDRNAKVKSEDRRTARNDTPTATTDRVINSKLEELIKRLDAINKKLTELTQRIVKKINIKRKENMQELEEFKQSINIADVAQDMGYEIDKKKSTRKVIVLKSGGDVIIVSRNSNGHYIYFNPNNQYDKGTIIDFVQNRTKKNLGQVRKILREYINKGTSIELEPSNLTNNDIKEMMSKVDKFGNKWKEITSKEKVSFETRGISDNTIQNCEHIYFDWDKDKFFCPVYNEFGICGILEMNDNMKDKYFQKGSIKGIWTDKKVTKNIKTIVITESVADSLSLKELQQAPDEEVLHIATLGRMGNDAKETLKAIFKRLPGAEIVIATDNDEAGENIAGEVLEIAKDAGIENINRLTFGEHKDANEYLQAIREQEKEQRRQARVKQQHKSRGISR